MRPLLCTFTLFVFMTSVLDCFIKWGGFQGYTSLGIRIIMTSDLDCLIKWGGFQGYTSLGIIIIDLLEAKLLKLLTLSFSH